MDLRNREQLIRGFYASTAAAGLQDESSAPPAGLRRALDAAPRRMRGVLGGVLVAGVAVIGIICGVTLGFTLNSIGSLIHRGRA